MIPPDVSRAVALIAGRLELSPGPVLDELHEAAAKAKTVDDLPQWAKNVLVSLEGEIPNGSAGEKTAQRPAR